MTEPDALARFRDVAALWSVGQAGVEDVVRAACDGLLAGLDTPALATVAAMSIHARDHDLQDSLTAALTELGLPVHAPGTLDAQEAALRVLAARTLAGRMTPRELTAWAYRVIGHDRLPAAAELIDLDGDYDVIDATGGGGAETTDAEVLARARILANPPT